MIKQHGEEIKKLNFGLTELRVLQDTQAEMSFNKPEIHCTQMFTAALFATAKTWKPKMRNIHTNGYYSALQKEGNSGTRYNMDEP